MFVFQKCCKVGLIMVVMDSYGIHTCAVNWGKFALLLDQSFLNYFFFVFFVKDVEFVWL